MRVCIVSSKECWQSGSGWMSSGGFPVQMRGIASLFDEAELLVVEVAPREGGEPLPPAASVLPLARPAGRGARRKLSMMLRFPYYALVMARSIRRADVVHVPLPGDVPLVALLVALVMRKRVIARYGGSWDTTSETTLMNRIVRRWLRACAGGRNVMLATGAGHTPPAPEMHWLPATAISAAELRSVRVNLGRAPARPPRLAYVGRLSPEKGVDDLLRAMAILRTDPPSTAMLPTLRIIGDGPERQALERLTERDRLHDVVSFAGQLDRASLLEELARTDVCVLPSRSESFCKARLDAMLCGVPVVTTAVGFGRDIIGADGERGWLVPPNAPADLAAVLGRITRSDIDWTPLRRRCRAYAKSITTEQWVDALGRICAEQWNITFCDGRLRA